MTDTTISPGPDNGGGPGNTWRLVGWGGAAGLLLLPLVAMQFTDEVAWDLADFVVFGVMLASVGGAFELALRLSRNVLYRAAAGIALLTAFLLAWVNLAVGIIGSENNPANLMYAGVLGIGLIGAIAARGQPQGMARCLVIVAAAQALVATIAVIGGLAEPYNGPLELAALNGLFLSLWLAAAWLYSRSARSP